MYKVLLADDEEVILKGLKGIIKWEEFNLEIAAYVSNGMEAMEIVQDQQIDILITDIRMPIVDGLQLIRRIREQQLNIKCIVLSGYSEFEYVKEAAKLGIENYILKPVDRNELTSTIINTVNKIENELNKNIIDREGINIIRNNILSRWVSGDIEDNELHERAELLNLDIHYKEFMTAIIKLADPPSSENSEPIKDRNIVSLNINKICSAEIAEGGLGAVFIDLTGNIVLLFAGDNLKSIHSDIMFILTNCIEKINLLLERDIFVTIGSIEMSYQDVYKSYNIAKRLLEYSLIYGANTIIEYDEIQSSITNWQKEFQIDFNLLSQFIRNKSTPAVLDFIQDVFVKMKNIEDLNPTYIQNIAIDILFHLINTIKLLNYNTDKVFHGYRDFLSDVYQFTNIDNMKHWMEETAIKCMNILSEEDGKISPLIRRVLEYINKNYDNEINLSTVAYEFGLNSFYLGQQFKKETSENFTNFLNTIRVERGKELLLSTNMKTADIAKKVGYSNTNYFSTIFKKITGISPSEFKGE